MPKLKHTAMIPKLDACVQILLISLTELTRKRATTDQTIIVRRAVKSLTKALNVPFTRIAKPSVCINKTTKEIRSWWRCALHEKL